MKNVHFLACLLFSSITLHCMESGKLTLNESSSSESQSMKQDIKNDCKNYFKNRLFSYIKLPVRYDDIDDMQKKYFSMTNKKSTSFLSQLLHRDVYDEETGNNFLHLAVKNRDLITVKWLMNVMQHPLSIKNVDGKEPIDFCIAQLMPNADEENKLLAHDILDIVTTGYAKVGFDYDCRRDFLKKIVKLEFEHAKQGTNFVLKEDILKRFLGDSSATEENVIKKSIKLSEIYQEVCDEKKNTFTHILVSRSLSDQLYKFIEKNYISFLKNKENQDPLLLAQKNFIEVAHKLFQQCAPNKNFNIAEDSKEGNEKKCCYYMLLNLQKKQDNNRDFKQCCDKHIL